MEGFRLQTTLNTFYQTEEGVAVIQGLPSDARLQEVMAVPLSDMAGTRHPSRFAIATSFRMRRLNVFKKNLSLAHIKLTE